MPDIFLHIVGPLRTDPELETGDILTLERSDGKRSVWRQRLRCSAVSVYAGTGGRTEYAMEPVEES